MPSLFIFSRDPGPTNQLVAAVEVLQRRPDEEEPAGLIELRAAAASLVSDVRIVARPPGEAIWRSAGYSTFPWDGSDDQAARDILEAMEAGLVLTGADDIDEPSDRALWRAARARGIASHVLLDHPANLPARFADGSGRFTYPDRIYVPDGTFAARAVEAGIPRDLVAIVGDLHHDRLAKLADASPATEIGDLRRSWGANGAETVIVFASECAREMRARGRPSPYDEIEVLANLLRCLAAGERPGGGPIDPASTLVVVRPHPRDQAGKYDALLAAHHGAPRVAISAAGMPHKAVLAADLVAGMNSSLLYEAMALGRPAISLTGHDLAAGKSAAG